MAQVHPFRAYRYNPAKCDSGRVLTQPYDKITPAMQEKYYAADAHNLIVVEKGRTQPQDGPGNNVYTRAAAALREWIAQGVVVQEPKECFYAYLQEYAVPGSGERRTRNAFIGLCTLEDYENKVIFRHERTLSGPKADRLELLRHTKTHTGQLFMLYADQERRIDALLAAAAAAAAPAMELRDEYGVMHRLWLMADAEQVAEIQRVMAAQKLVIADGHHRYETALNYRNERRAQAGGIVPDAPYERTMMTFVNAESEGLTILPTHRVVAHVADFSWSGFRRHLEPWFQVEEISSGKGAGREAALRQILEKMTALRDARAIGLLAGAAAGREANCVLTLRPGANLGTLLREDSPLQRELDVALLHHGILEGALGISPESVSKEANLSYEREATAALRAVESGAAQLAFLLNPVDVRKVIEVATAGEVMPQKSTDFYPKLLSGVTMCRLEE